VQSNEVAFRSDAACGSFAGGRIHDDGLARPIAKLQPTYGEAAADYAKRENRIGDPATLILIR
jgi:hypothetical protein